MPEWLPTLFTKSAPSELVEEVSLVMRDFHPIGFRAIIRAVADSDIREVLPRIDVPTLLVYGDTDARSPLSIGEQLHAQIPGSQFSVLPGVGHLSNLEAPDRFNREVRSFLRAHEAPQVPHPG